jgi:hypothetical protein
MIYLIFSVYIVLSYWYMDSILFTTDEKSFLYLGLSFLFSIGMLFIIFIVYLFDIVIYNYRKFIKKSV